MRDEKGWWKTDWAVSKFTKAVRVRPWAWEYLNEKRGNKSIARFLDELLQKHATNQKPNQSKKTNKEAGAEL